MIETVIKPQKTLLIDVKELWRYKGLFYFFAWRDVKVRYKQTVIGAGWAVFQPFITMVIFTLFFNKVAGIGSDSVPYAIFSYSGLLFWQFFSNALTQSSNSLVNNQSVITKIYFPRIIAPLASTLVGLIDFFFAAIIFVGMMVYFHIAPGFLGLALFIPMIVVTFVAASGAGLYLATLNVKYRDVKQALPFFIQTMLFLTPVIYPVSKVPAHYQWILYLNPMTGVITAMRYGLLHEGSLNWGYFIISMVSTVALFIIGLLYFKSQERKFADII
jgi:lipopolysaccharide transport system permease protein